MRFNWSLKIGGVFTDPDGIGLTDAGASYGVKRLDTDGVVQAAGAIAAITGGVIVDLPPGNVNWVRDGTGLFHFDQGFLSPGILYSAAVAYDLPGAYPTMYDTVEETASSSAGAAGIYHNEADIADLIGTENLQIASDLENDDTETDHVRTQKAIDVIEAMANRKLRAIGLSVVPLVDMDTGTALLIRDACAHGSAWWLYQNRGIKDLDPSNPPTGVAGLFENHKKLFDEFFDNVRFEPMSITARLVNPKPASKIGSFSWRRRLAGRASFPLPPLGPL